MLFPNRVPTSMLTASSIVAVVCVSSASASVTFTSATRTISATASNSPLGGAADTTTDSVSGFGAYDNSVQRQLQTINEPLGTLQEATAEQHSFIGTDALTFSGRVFGVDHAVSSGSGNSEGRSQLVLNFTTDASTPWTSSFSNVNDPFSTGNLSSAVLVIRNAANVNVAVLNGLTGLSSPQSGILPAGSYTLTLDIGAGHGSTGTGSRGINYNWSFSVPAPANGALLACAGVVAVRRRRNAGR